MADFDNNNNWNQYFMITISNFEKYVLPQILMRGEDYYESDAVLEIEEESPGEWIATVCGTENY